MKLKKLLRKTAGGRHGWYETDLLLSIKGDALIVRKPLGLPVAKIEEESQGIVPTKAKTELDPSEVIDYKGLPLPMSTQSWGDISTSNETVLGAPKANLDKKSSRTNIFKRFILWLFRK